MKHILQESVSIAHFTTPSNAHYGIRRHVFYATFSAILAMKPMDSGEERYIELSIGQNISAGTILPVQLSSARIIGLMNQRRQSASLEQLSQTQCRIHSVPTRTSEQIARSHGMGSSWPWFTMEDGTVQFDRASSKWFLAGSKIAQYECI
ncbi:hypothetical protein BS50DRAFT_132433 [Corynespora cassiicola Philippines]|uniref:Uncharacterized protein n=1 Tax=Corynespora cassiicola Philippines TaxID=1448308 RepID=A0A2T2NBU7_CORCC|nr:hypothetical protein BS50DRAFT_132433 [Corynespora cassiicola Philippines]